MEQIIQDSIKQGLIKRKKKSKYLQLYTIDIQNLQKQNKILCNIILSNFQNFEKVLQKVEKNQCKFEFVNFPVYKESLDNAKLLKQIINKKKNPLLRFPFCYVIQKYKSMCYEFKKIYLKDCSCENVEKQVYICQDLIQILQSHSHVDTQYQYKPRCKICFTDYTQQKNQNVLKRYQKLELLIMGKTKGQKIIHVFLEDYMVDMAPQNSHIDIIAIVKLSSTIKKYNDKMKGQIENYFVVRQLKKIKQKTNYLMDYFWNLNKQFQNQESEQSINLNQGHESLFKLQAKKFLNLFRFLASQFKCNNTLLLFYVILHLFSLLKCQILNLDYDNCDTKSKRSYLYKDDFINLLIVTQYPKTLAKQIKDDFYNKFQQKIYKIIPNFEDKKALNMFLLENQNKILILYKFSDWQKQIQQVILNYFSHKTVEVNKIKINIKLNFIFVITQEEQHKFSQLPNYFFLCINFYQFYNQEQLCQSEEMQLIDFLLRQNCKQYKTQKQQEIQETQEIETFSFISGISNIFSQIRLDQKQNHLRGQLINSHPLEIYLNQEQFTKFLDYFKKYPIQPNENLKIFQNYLTLICSIQKTFELNLCSKKQFKITLFDFFVAIVIFLENFHNLLQVNIMQDKRSFFFVSFEESLETDFNVQQREKEFCDLCWDFFQAIIQKFICPNQIQVKYIIISYNDQLKYQWSFHTKQKSYHNQWSQ